MTVTPYSPGRKKIAGFVKVLLGAGFASVNAPKLTEISMDGTCAIDAVDPSTDIKMAEEQFFCDVDARESIEKRVRKLGNIPFRGSGDADEAAFLALFQEGQTVGMFIRPYTSSSTAPAVGQKGDAMNFVVAALDRGPLKVGDYWTYIVQTSDVTRSNLNVALV